MFFATGRLDILFNVNGIRSRCPTANGRPLFVAPRIRHAGAHVSPKSLYKLPFPAYSGRQSPGSWLICSESNFGSQARSLPPARILLERWQFCLFRLEWRTASACLPLFLNHIREENGDKNYYFYRRHSVSNTEYSRRIAIVSRVFRGQVRASGKWCTTCRERERKRGEFWFRQWQPHHRHRRHRRRRSEILIEEVGLTRIKVEISLLV